MLLYMGAASSQQFKLLSIFKWGFIWISKQIWELWHLKYFKFLLSLNRVYILIILEQFLLLQE